MALLLKRLIAIVLLLGATAYLSAPLFIPGWHNGRYDLAFLLILFSSVSSWIAGVEMRRKIKKDLGRDATDADLTSIDTWMKVEDIERTNNDKNPLG